jgi:hypothetical protein
MLRHYITPSALVCSARLAMCLQLHQDRPRESLLFSTGFAKRPLYIQVCGSGVRIVFSTASHAIADWEDLVIKQRVLNFSKAGSCDQGSNS